MKKGTGWKHGDKQVRLNVMGVCSIHSPGLKGLDSVLWLRDEFNPITTFFEDCGEHTIDIV